MAKRFKKTKEKTLSRYLKEETLQGILGIVFFVLTFFFILSSLGKAGVVGDRVYTVLKYFMGIGYFVLPFLFAILGISSFKSLGKKFSIARAIGAIAFFLSSLGVINMLSDERGGVVGKWISFPLVRLFDKEASLIFLFATIVISLLVILDSPLTLRPFKILWQKLISGKKEAGVVETTLIDEEDSSLIEEDHSEEEVGAETHKEESEEIPPKIKGMSSLKQAGADEGNLAFLTRKSASLLPFVPIPLSILEGDRGKPGVGDIKANLNIIKRTLQNFGIEVEMDEVSIGPSVTRYALKPAEGVKLSRIVGLQNDLALALAAHPIRIEAPIPGKSLVGIEIPNSIKTTVGLATLLSSDEFQNSEKSLLVSLGKGVSGKSYFGNLAKMPHLLIAGATGSGKSVTIHAIITSLLYRNSPEDLRFIMIDPKRVELTLYNKIPHLLTPVITDAKKVIMALKWAAKEMDRRYDILESESVRDIESYHKNIATPARKRFEGKMMREEASKLPETMPYIVIIIDELADIMATYPRELEAAIVRLAQMSRAVGIHLILSTQRPSVNVITGLIKANIPARLALQVASQIDSRTILDGSGAEKLLGAGDMLYLSGEMSQPSRIQSAFISETEVKKVVKFLHDAYRDELPSEITLGDTPEKNSIFESSFDEDPGDDDDLYEEAKEEILKAGKASTSYLQRRLRIGYARAARLIDLLEKKGLIGKGEGAKPREVFGANPTPETPPPEGEGVM